MSSKKKKKKKDLFNGLFSYIFVVLFNALFYYLGCTCQRRAKRNALGWRKQQPTSKFYLCGQQQTAKKKNILGFVSTGFLN
jgi:hypothetical protein